MWESTLRASLIIFFPFFVLPTRFHFAVSPKIHTAFSPLTLFFLFACRKDFSSAPFPPSEKKEKKRRENGGETENKWREKKKLETKWKYMGNGGGANDGVSRIMEGGGSSLILGTGGGRWGGGAMCSCSSCTTTATPAITACLPPCPCPSLATTVVQIYAPPTLLPCYPSPLGFSRHFCPTMSSPLPVPFKGGEGRSQLAWPLQHVPKQRPHCLRKTFVL